jgi:hypothetical protein
MPAGPAFARRCAGALRLAGSEEYASWNLNGSFSKDAAAVAAHGQSERAKAMFLN